MWIGPFDSLAILPSKVCLPSKLTSLSRCFDTIETDKDFQYTTAPLHPMPKDFTASEKTCEDSVREWRKLFSLFISAKSRAKLLRSLMPSIQANSSSLSQFPIRLRLRPRPSIGNITHRQKLARAHTICNYVLVLSIHLRPIMSDRVSLIQRWQSFHTG